MELVSRKRKFLISNSMWFCSSGPKSTFSTASRESKQRLSSLKLWIGHISFSPNDTEQLNNLNSHYLECSIVCSQRFWPDRTNYGPTVRSSMALTWDWPGKDCVNAMIVDNFDIGRSTKHIWSYYHWIGKHSQSCNLISGVKNSCIESFVCLHKTSVFTGKLYSSLALKRFKIWFRIRISDKVLLSVF